MMLPNDLLGTFVRNQAYEAIESSLIDLCIKDTVHKRTEKRIRLRLSGEAYERGARAYYNKYGTVGEF